MIVMYWVDSDCGAPEPHEGCFWYMPAPAQYEGWLQVGLEANDCVWLVPGTYVDDDE